LSAWLPGGSFGSMHQRSPVRRPSCGRVVLWLGLAALSCQTGTGPSTATRIEIMTATGGLSLDPDGYGIRMDGALVGHVAPNGFKQLNGVSAGPHQIELHGIASNCSVNGANPVAVTAQAGMLVRVPFQILCT